MKNIKKIIIRPGLSIKQALKRMDEAGKKILFVVDGKRKILGAVTDGDFRKWILKGNSLEKSIALVMNHHPVVFKEGFSREEAKLTMVRHTIDCIPIEDDNNRIVSAIWWRDIFDPKVKSHKSINVPVVIMAGGEGARLAPFTNILPKPLFPVGDKPIIELIMDRFIEYGCKKFYLSVNYKSSILKAYFSDSKQRYNINYIHEEKPLGTIGSLHMLKGRLNKPFFISNCDILIEADYSDILKFHKENKYDITLVVSMKHYTIPYGICEIENGGALKGIQEKPEYDLLVNAGVYLMDHKVLDLIPQNSFYHMTDLINDCMKKKRKVGVYPVSEKCWLDMGQLQELQNMLKKYEVK